MRRRPLTAPLKAIRLDFPPTLTGAKGQRPTPDMSAGALRKALYAASASAVRTKLPTTTKVAAKSAPSAYLLFTKDERPKLGSEFKGGPDSMKELGKRWSGLDDAARKPYVDQALKLKSELKSAPGALPHSALGRNRWSLTHLACAVGEEITVLKAVSTEAGLTTLASNASSAAIQVQWNASSHRACKLTCPHRNARGSSRA